MKKTVVKKAVTKKSDLTQEQWDMVGQAIKTSKVAKKAVAKKAVSPMPKLPNTNTSVRYIYVTGRNKRRVTVAYVFDDTMKAIKLSTAECVPTDNFVKKIGRGIATSRLKNDYRTTTIPYSIMGGDSYKAIADYVVSNIKTLTLQEPQTLDNYSFIMSVKDLFKNK